MEIDTKIDRHKMFSVFIKNINYEKKSDFRKSIPDVDYITQLFEKFGIDNITGSTSKNWLASLDNRNCGFMSAFSTKTITIQHLQNCFDFFKKNINSNISIVQKNLAEHKTLLTEVNLETYICGAHFQPVSRYHICNQM